jgi:hypothetical protein
MGDRNKASKQIITIMPIAETLTGASSTVVSYLFFLFKSEVNNPLPIVLRNGLTL